LMTKKREKKWDLIKRQPLQKRGKRNGI
jgi:hypothetical protein